MTILYLISQIFALISFIFSLVAYYRTKKEKIMLTMITSNIFNLLHYFILGAFSGGITKILAILRDIIIVYKEKKHLNMNYILFIFIIIYIIVAIINYQGIYSLLPLIAALIYIIAIRNGDEGIIKKSAFYSYFLRLLYNIAIGSIIAIIANIISIISTGNAIYLHKKHKNFKKIKRSRTKGTAQ